MLDERSLQSFIDESDMGIGCEAQIIRKYISSWTGFLATHQEEIQDENGLSLETPPTNTESEHNVSEAREEFKGTGSRSVIVEERAGELFRCCGFHCHVMSESRTTSGTLSIVQSRVFAPYSCPINEDEASRTRLEYVDQSVPAPIPSC